MLDEARRLANPTINSWGLKNLQFLGIWTSNKQKLNVAAKMSTKTNLIYNRPSVNFINSFTQFFKNK